MIVDHPVTRGGVRTLGIAFGATVPIAAAYFLYMMAYKESPIDTLLLQIPHALKLFHANRNTSSITTMPSAVLESVTSLASAATTATTTNTATAATATAAAAAAKTALAASSGPVSMVDIWPSSSSAAAAGAAAAGVLANTSPTADYHHHNHHQHANYGSSSSSSSSSSTQPPPHSPYLVPALQSSLLYLVHFLEYQGIHSVSDLPGYRYLVPLLPIKTYIIDPLWAFFSAHVVLAWIVSLIHGWMAMELLFYFQFWRRLSQAQKVDRVVKGVGSRQGRQELFQRCMETVGSGDGCKRWVETWFDTGRTAQPARFEEIGRENMIQWLAWAFWAAPLEEVEVLPDDMAELCSMMDRIEKEKDVQFAPGFNPNVDCIRLNLDPVVASHRPLIYYALVWIANLISGFVFNLLGFTRFEGALDRAHRIKVRKAKHQHPTEEKEKARANYDLAYWYRPARDAENKVPLVFIHGIGVGLVQYIHFIVALSTLSRPILMIEVPYVSNRLVRTKCVLSPDESYFAVERILQVHGYQKATFMGHSLGTMLCSAIVRASPAHNNPDSIVAGLILVDPICFLTHHSIARNFAYRIPTTASQLIMDLFAARELGTSWFIMRRFCWDQCVMFPSAWRRRHHRPAPLQGRLSPVLPKMTRVFLSREDNLLDMNVIATYLKKQVGLLEEREELVVMDHMDHAAFLLRPYWFAKVLKAAREC
ncbi:hypothetical protein DFQ26_009775 [Actinomortierella ambigua]|nr:hypothetical protein DFQ26_009775 [Actinomortierella ambigua]